MFLKRQKFVYECDCGNMFRSKHDGERICRECEQPVISNAAREGNLRRLSPPPRHPASLNGLYIPNVGSGTFVKHLKLYNHFTDPRNSDSRSGEHTCSTTCYNDDGINVYEDYEGDLLREDQPRQRSPRKYRYECACGRVFKSIFDTEKVCSNCGSDVMSDVWKRENGQLESESVEVEERELRSHYEYQCDNCGNMYISSSMDSETTCVECGEFVVSDFRREMEKLEFENMNFPQRKKKPEIERQETIRIPSPVEEKREVQTINISGGGVTIRFQGGGMTIRTQRPVEEKPPAKKMTKEGELNEKIRKLQAELEKKKEAEEATLCKICFERKIRISFNCGHVMCEPCSNNMRECPFCKRLIRNRNTIFLV